MKFQIKPKYIVILLVLILVGFTLFSSIVIIPTGYTGVKSTFGQVSEAVMQNGFNFKIPFITTVDKVNNKQQDYTIDSQTIIWGETKARTAISFSGITISATINPEYSAWLVSHISNYKDNIITTPIVSSAIKTVSKTLTDEEATNRSTIEERAKEELQKSLNGKYGREVIFIEKVIITNADFEESYNTAVAEKQKAQLEYEKQQIENKKSIEKAEAEAKAKKIKAEGEAEAAIIAAEGEKKANDTLNKSLNEQIIKNKAVDKWNGELPQVVGDSGVLLDFTE